MAGNQLEFYRARIEQVRAEAQVATLEHVRERCKRSEKAWTALADRAEKSERLRAAEARRKSDQQTKKQDEETNTIEHD